MGDFFDIFGEGTGVPEIVRLPARCPKCGSSRCQLQATGRKTGTVICGTLGAVLAAGLSGAEGGAVVGTLVAGVVPPAAPVGTIIGAAIGFSWGAIAGHALGTEIDERFLRLYCCLDCEAEFRS